MKKEFCKVCAAMVLLVVVGCNEKPETRFVTETVQKSTLSNSVTATGTIEPISQVEVGTQVSGIISKIYADYNAEVKAGQLIAELDRSVLETELNASEATMNSAKTEMDYQKINYDRTKGLYEKELVSLSEYESAEYQYNRAKYAYNQSRAGYEKAVTNIGYTRIYSPIDGVVLSRAVDEGQTVASGFSTPTLFTIANDLRKMRVIADVDEADIGEVKEGQLVSFTVDAFADLQFEGRVTQVRLLAETVSNVVTYEVVIEAPNPDLTLKPGLTANVVIHTLSKENITTVPVRALRFSPGNGVERQYEQSVWVALPGGTLEERAVAIGLSDGISTEIVSGVEPGEEVVAGVASGVEATENASGSGNPFMPKPPTNGNNKRTK